MGETYAVLLGQLERAANELNAVLSEHGQPGDAASTVVARLKGEPFRVLVLGEFSRGKSTFINAILGEKALPTSVRPTTAVISIIRHSGKRTATIHWRGEAAPTTVDLPVGAASRELSKVVTAKNKNSQDISKVEIELPMPGIGLPIEIVDTPGVNDLDAQREEVTYGYLARADAAILMLDLQQPMSASEKRFLTDRVLGNDIRKLLFVVNKIDQEPPDKTERALAFVRARVDELPPIAGAPILPVASKPALLARQDGNSEQLQASRFPEFENFLVGFLAQASGKSRVVTAGERIDRVVQAAREEIANIAASIQGEQAELHGKVQAANARFREQVSRRQRAQADIELAAARYVDSVRTKLRASLAETRATLDGIMARPSFPSDTDLAALRSALGSGTRSLAEIPAAEASVAFAQAVSSDGGGSTAQVHAQATALTAGIQTRTDITVESKAKQGMGVGATIGAVAGAALFGPVGSLIGVTLGGWIGGAVAGPKREEIAGKVNEVLRTVEGQTDQSSQRSAHEFVAQLRAAIIAPLDDAIHRAEAGLDEIAKAASEGREERDRRAQVCLGQTKRLDDVSKTLADLKEG